MILSVTHFQTVIAIDQSMLKGPLERRSPKPLNHLLYVLWCYVIMLHAMLGYVSLLKPIFSLSVSRYISLISGLEVLLEHNMFHFCKYHCKTIFISFLKQTLVSEGIKSAKHCNLVFNR